MMRDRHRSVLAAVALACSMGRAGATTGCAVPKPTLTMDAVNGTGYTPMPGAPAKTPTPEILKAEILLDRARFSPGSIDGIDGDNVRKAIAAYRRQMGLSEGSDLDEPTWDKLTAGDTEPVLVRRPLTADDLKGPFTTFIPARFESQSGLRRLGYKDVKEELSEQYHVSIAVLVELNPAERWTTPGSEIVVPQVVVERRVTKVTKVVVDKAIHAVEAFGEDGRLVAFYPASIGSEEKPAPSGQFTIRRVLHNPPYHYDPKFAFKGVRTRKPFTIAPGPNNPVGSVWMDLSYEGYGIHGTPEPDLIGKTQSHGCIRMTNWDAQDLASMVSDGTSVSFVDGAGPAPELQPAAGIPAPPPTSGAIAPASSTQ